MTRKLVALVILDSFGAGALPDAAEYGDAGADTLGHIAGQTKNFNLPNLARLGLYELIAPSARPAFPPGKITGCYGKMAEASDGKDTPIGHWEITGLITEKPLPTYPDGFPKELIERYEKIIGVKTLGNYAASGTEILKQLGDEHYKTGYPIVYTSADSVFQVAAHEDPKIFGLKKLYEICEAVRKMLAPPHNVGRVIARPFIGEPGAFARTSNRHDYALDPAGETLLDKLRKAGVRVSAVGKIYDIFNGKGIDETVRTRDNRDGMARTLEAVRKAVDGPSGTKTFVFTNLVDFDMLWGHRRNVAAYYEGLKEFDDFLPRLEDALGDEGVLLIAADHGCDPAYAAHTDHTREHVPVLVSGQGVKKGINLGVRKTFADAGQTISELFGAERTAAGVSFAKEIVL
ncbi:MAG: phosphopentomutase [Elusimicrobia bacterium HGW-Elusimicrobia-1]|jgi:phosphopentomutase|nr:MAG: phosphopentomutase [Elusimicrobia bacterium HGW-Elusimicrobia-1]